MQRSLLLLLAFAPLACKPVAEPAIDDAPLSGRQIYMARCIACHQADGSGIPAICPPLANSPRLTGPPEDLIRILLLGTKGGIARDGGTYRGIMPSWKFDLSDAQIADVANDLYARWNATAPTKRPLKNSSPPRKICGSPSERDQRLQNTPRVATAEFNPDPGMTHHGGHGEMRKKRRHGSGQTGASCL